MTRDDVVVMAVNAGANSHFVKHHIAFIEAFAKLVEAHTRGQMFKPDWDNYRQGLIDGAVSEREACAKLAQKTVCDTHIPTGVRIYGTAAAKAIRARGNT